MKKTFVIAIAVIIEGIVGTGCAKRFIPNTEIPDTEENREIIAFCERYRRAVEDINVGLLLSLASPRYFDNSGTSKAEDDLDKAGLENTLKRRFNAIKSVRYEIRYRDIYTKGRVLYVEFTFTMSLQYEINGKTKWANETADNRLEIERVNEGYLILSGM